jgi:FKBP-type peptidyl-prolyl cis-trans isomerase
LGYSTSGSGKTIPAYSPLIFEIEIVEKPEE